VSYSSIVLSLSDYKANNLLSGDKATIEIGLSRFSRLYYNALILVSYCRAVPLFKANIRVLLSVKKAIALSYPKNKSQLPSSTRTFTLIIVSRNLIIFSFYDTSAKILLSREKASTKSDFINMYNSTPVPAFYNFISLLLNINANILSSGKKAILLTLISSLVEAKSTLKVYSNIS
jgi:hypothetical protein